MKRSAGVTVSAVIVFIGSVAVLISGAFTILGFSMAPMLLEQQPHFLRYFAFFFAVLIFGIAGWGISSGVGLINLREWSRISMLIFSALLLFFCLPGALMMTVMPFPTPPSNAGDPKVMAHTLAIARIFIVVFYGLLAILGSWWLYFFTKQSTKEQFLKLTDPESALSAAMPMSREPVRPLSITIIGWYMQISAFFAVAFLFAHPPIFLFGFFFSGWIAASFAMILGVLQILIGSGLLKLRLWSRTLAIYYFQFLIFNSLTVILVPGTQARFDQTVSETQGMLGVPASPMHFPYGSVSFLHCHFLVSYFGFWLPVNHHF